MQIFRSRTAIALASAAALSMTASPAMARGWHRHHDRGIDAGDVLAGVLIIGGIAAIASAASKSSRDRREREARYPDDRRYPDSRDYRGYPDYRDRDGGYAEREEERPTGQRNWSGASGVDNAIGVCADEIERGDRRIDTIDTVNREDDGWRVDGRVLDGRDFSCTVDRDGRIRRVSLDGQAII